MPAPSEHEAISSYLAAALDALGLPVLLHDDNHVLYANGAARQILGAATPAEIEGLCLDTFAVPELASVIKERRTYLLQKDMAFTDLPIMMRTLDGRTIHLRVDAQPITVDGSTVGMVTIAQRPGGEERACRY
jgi:PAS domain S-box-containing protein